MDLPLLRNLKQKDLEGKLVLLRLDLNIPLEEGVPLSDYRIRRSLPTIDFLRKNGARIIILSHHSEAGQTLQPLSEQLAHFFPTVFISDVLKKTEVEEALTSQKDLVLLCENLRLHEGEEANDTRFAGEVASLGDLYINDAFAVSHRKHASIVSLPKLLPSYAGFLFEEEVRELSRAFNPPHPFLFILGGGKAKSKLHLVESFLGLADSIFLCGAIASSFLKAKGYEVGTSVVEEIKESARYVLEEKSIYLPVDLRVSNTKGVAVKKPSEVTSEDKILDMGPETLTLLQGCVEKACFILWNGPIGNYLIPGFGAGTEKLIEILAGSDAETVVGGGDTVTLITKKEMLDTFDFVSTGGGAMLDFLADQTLPGIEALQKATNR